MAGRGGRGAPFSSRGGGAASTQNPARALFALALSPPLLSPPLLIQIHGKINATKFLVKEAEDTMKNVSLKAEAIDIVTKKVHRAGEEREEEKGERGEGSQEERGGPHFSPFTFHLSPFTFHLLPLSTGRGLQRDPGQAEGAEDVREDARPPAQGQPDCT